MATTITATFYNDNKHTANMPFVAEAEIRKELAAAIAEAERRKELEASSELAAATGVAQQQQQQQGRQQQGRQQQQKVERPSLQAFAELGGEMGRTLFSFAANAVKQAGELTSRFGGEMQVGDRKVYMVREIAEGGFSKVFLVRDSGDAAQMYALKQMLCQTRDSLEDAQRELATLRVSTMMRNVVLRAGELIWCVCICVCVHLLQHSDIHHIQILYN